MFCHGRFDCCCFIYCRRRLDAANYARRLVEGDLNPDDIEDEMKSSEQVMDFQQVSLTAKTGAPFLPQERLVASPSRQRIRKNEYGKRFV